MQTSGPSIVVTPIRVRLAVGGEALSDGDWVVASCGLWSGHRLLTSADSFLGVVCWQWGVTLKHLKCGKHDRANTSFWGRRGSRCPRAGFFLMFAGGRHVVDVAVPSNDGTDSLVLL